MSKLEAVKDRLVKINADCESVELIQANITDEDSLTRMARQTKVILSTAGPFIRFVDHMTMNS